MRPLIEVSRRAARILAFLSTCRLRLIVTFCFSPVLELGIAPPSARNLRVTRSPRAVNTVGVCGQVHLARLHVNVAHKCCPYTPNEQLERERGPSQASSVFTAERRPRHS